MCRPTEKAFASPCFRANSGISFLKSSTMFISTVFGATIGAKVCNFGTQC